MARTLDLSHLVVVVPGGRAGRQVLNHLVALAESGGSALVPPRIVTVGHLREELCGRNGRAPGRLARCFAWAAVLRAAEPATLRAALPNPPESGDAVSWLRVAAMIDRVHVDLAGHGLVFADVVRASPPSGDEARWAALARLQVAFLEALDQAGLTDPHAAAIAQVRNGELKVPSEVVLVAVSELPRLAAEALRGLKGRTTALIPAPLERADWFDDLGCAVPERWHGAGVDLSTDRIRVVDGPGDQADAAIDALADLGDRFASDEVVVGVPDAEVVPCLRAREGRLGAARFRDAAGMRVERSGPHRLMQAVRAFVSSGTFRDWATLLRHPAIEAWLGPRVHPERRAVESWLTVLDDYAKDHLPGRVTGQWADAPGYVCDRLTAVYDATRSLLGPLWPAEGAPTTRPIGQWAEPILAVLRTVYGGRPLNTAEPSHRVTIEACDLLLQAAAELAQAPAGVEASLSAADAIGTLLLMAEGAAIAPEPDSRAVELLGWLELAFDDAPAVVVTGLNEGRVPRSHRPDPFLPDSLRTALGLPDARSEAARDVYLLSVLAGSRKDLVLIAGRRARRGDPLLPSRLLFACDDSVLPERVRLFVLKPDAAEPREAVGGGASHFRVAPQAPYEQPLKIRVTAFRSFLQSPYGFFLEHLLGLEERTDLVRDLDPASFGSMVHEALREFAASPASASDQEGDIRDAMRGAMDAYVARTFGTNAPVAVRLQQAQAQERLAEIAALEARRRRDGWRILHAEWSPPAGAPFVVDGEPVILSGKIDRIDRHEDGRLSILDYKTSDKGQEPREAHRKKSGDWIDLQLPLYRHLASSIITGSPLELGYIIIPGAPGAAKIVEAGWTEAELDAADEAARDVIRKIRSRDVFSAGDKPPDSGVFGRICGQDIVGAEPPEGEEDEEEEP